MVPFLEALLELRVAETRATEARRFYVSGIVQGVGFRFFVQRVAARLSLAGYVKNLRDGRVEVYAIGPPAALNELRGELKRGPRAARIEDIGEEREEVLREYENSFSVEEDW